MKLRCWRSLLLACVVMCASPALWARTARAERAAADVARQEMAQAPLHENLPDYTLPADKLAEAQDLGRIRVRLHNTAAGWSVVSLLLVLGCGGAVMIRNVAVRTSRWLVVQALVFATCYFVLLFLLDLPLLLYGHHLSVRYGFSVQGWASWLADHGKTLLLNAGVGGLAAAGLMWLIRKLPRYWWAAAWGVAVVLIVGVLWLKPLAVDPMFDHFEPLAATQPLLTARLEVLADHAGIHVAPDRIFLMRASDKVTTANAYVTGFGGSKRVVVWDTLLSSSTPDEVLFTVGHEFGHYALNHVLIGTGLAALGLLPALALAAWMANWMIARFGELWHIGGLHDWAGIVVLALAFTVLQIASEPIDNTVSRHIEHDADVYGQEAIHGLVADPGETARRSFESLGMSSLEDPNPARLTEFWTYGHPAIGRRAAFAKAYDPWAEGMEPKYFKAASRK